MENLLSYSNNDGKRLIPRLPAVLPFLLFVQAVCAQTTARLIPKKGLYVSTQGLEWIMGSELNFFTPDKKHHHYYFTWWEQDADSTADGRKRLIIGSANTAVYGNYSLALQGKEYRTDIDCQWNRPDSALADIVYAKIWLPFLSEAIWRNGRNEPLSYPEQFNDSLLFLHTPFGDFRIECDRPFRIRTDAKLQPGAKDYARRAQYLLFYEENIAVDRQKALHRSFRIEQIKRKENPQADELTLRVTPTLIPAAWKPDTTEHLLLPKPQRVEWKAGAYVIPVVTSGTADKLTGRFRELTAIYWKEAATLHPWLSAKLNKTLHPEGYTLDISDSDIRIVYGSPVGLDHALLSLARLVRADNGKLVIPCGHIEDFPAVNWRGIHMFTGPTSLSLHRQMYERVLLPLKMNKVVLQCEQAQWSSRPETHNPISIPMKDLEAEFAFLRKNHCEPIPLVQSLGHMEWFFKPKQNRFMAVNPQYPYTLNPELPASRKAITQIWDEVFARLRPSVMHIGFDEIGMIGFNQPKENEIRYWKKQLAYLDAYAKKKRAKLMLWGDMGLGPDEGPDALNGGTKERAALLRSTIPPGSYVADWHYLNNPDPEVYRTSLRIWKNNRNIPLASPWLWPNNVRGFVLAAKEENAGVLQTTWADFESSERNMLLNIEQFGAYVLAMDYAWSGRKELPADLPYDPVEEWTGRYYRSAQPARPLNGWSLTGPVRFRNITREQKGNEPDSLELRFAERQAGGIRFQAETDNILPEGITVARLLLYDGEKIVYEKEIRYGVETRAASDNRPIYAHTKEKDRRTVYDFFPREIKTDRTCLIILHPGAGLQLNEWVLIY